MKNFLYNNEKFFKSLKLNILHIFIKKCIYNRFLKLKQKLSFKINKFNKKIFEGRYTM